MKQKRSDIVCSTPSLYIRVTWGQGSGSGLVTSQKSLAEPSLALWVTSQSATWSSWWLPCSSPIRDGSVPEPESD